jgi:hypothetical protein
MTGFVSYEPKEDGAIFVIVLAVSVLATAQEFEPRLVPESSMTGSDAVTNLGYGVEVRTD